MKSFALALCALYILMLGTQSQAQQPRVDGRAVPQAAPNDVTPEMWYYQQQLIRYDDPWQAVRRKAEQRAAERQARISAMKWYGYSNARPTANATPWGAMYSPSWTGNTNRPYAWGTNPRTVVVPIVIDTYQR